MEQIVEKVVGIAVGLFVVAALIPAALVYLANASFGNTNPAVITIVTILLPILAVVAIALYFLRP